MQWVLSKKGFVFVAGFLLLIIFGLGMMLSINAQKITTNPKESAFLQHYQIIEIVSEIENVHCKLSVQKLAELRLSAGNIQKAKDFCAKPPREKAAILEKLFMKMNNKMKPEGQIVGFNNSYSCNWNGSRNNGIPTYQDLGLTLNSCSWHDTTPDACKLQGSVGCLWGCTNTDPVLGWSTHQKFFPSRTALEQAILPKGYQLITNPVYGIDYRRTLPYGYSYELSRHSVDSTGKGYWHVEGPEPDPRFNWPGFLGGWWPVEVLYWHQIYNC